MTLPSVSGSLVDGGTGLSNQASRSVLTMGWAHNQTDNTLYAFTRPADVYSTVGYGPGADAVVDKLEVAKGTQYFLSVADSVAGAFGSVTKVGTGSGALTLTSSVPRDSYEAVIDIVTTGDVGVATFRYSLDNGDETDGGGTWVGPILTGATYDIPNTGIKLNFGTGAGDDYVAGDKFTFATTEPYYDATDVADAIAVLSASDVRFRFLHLVGVTDDADDSADIAAGLESELVALEAEGRYMRAIMEVADEGDAAVALAFADVVTPRVGWAAGTYRHQTKGVARKAKKNAGLCVASRQARQLQKAKRHLSTHLGRVREGALPASVRVLLRDERKTPALDAAGFITLRTITGKKGFFITRGQTGAAPDSDFKALQNGLVIDQFCELMNDALVEELNEDLVANADGTIDEIEARRIEGIIKGRARDQLYVTENVSQPPDCAVDRAVKLIPDKNLQADGRAVPKGYAENITFTVGFQLVQTTEE